MHLVIFVNRACKIIIAHSCIDLYQVYLYTYTIYSVFYIRLSVYKEALIWQT